MTITDDERKVAIAAVREVKRRLHLADVEPVYGDDCVLLRDIDDVCDDAIASLEIGRVEWRPER